MKKILKVFRLDLANVDGNVCLEIEKVMSLNCLKVTIIIVLLEADKDWGNVYEFFRSLYPKVILCFVSIQYCVELVLKRHIIRSS
jgi:hypothetical protein